MKFTIEVDEFWLEEEELTEALQHHVKTSVVHQISKDIEEKVRAEITEKVTEIMKTRTSVVIDKCISDFVDTDTITVGREKVSVREHLIKIFRENHGWNDPEKKMIAIAKKFGEELKVQYNNIFASKIVQNMKEQGLLKDDAVKLLLGD